MAEELELSLVELKNIHTNLVKERNKENRIARRDPTFSEEDKQKVFDESKRIIGESKEKLNKRRDGTKEVIFNLKAKRAEIKNSYKDKILETSAKTFDIEGNPEDIVKTFEEKLELFINNHKEIVEDYKAKHAELVVSTQAEIAKHKQEFADIKADKTIPLKEKDIKIDECKNLIFQLEHDIDRSKAKTKALIDEENKKFKAEYKELTVEKKWLINPKGKAIYELKQKRNQEVAEVNAEIDTERENLKFYNFFGYKFAINTRNKFFKLVNDTKQNFTHFDLFKEWLTRNILYIIIVVFIAIAAIYSGGIFLGWGSFVNILTATSFRLPLALGIAGIIVLTGTDLSAGRIVGLTSMVAIMFLGGKNDVGLILDWSNSMPGIWILVVLLMCMIVGALFGSLNGFFVAKYQIHPFIVTLSTQLITFGVIQTITDKSVLNMSNPSLGFDGTAGAYRNVVSGGFNLFGEKISMYVIYAIIITAIIWFIWNKTKLGKNMFAVGCNQEAAAVSGISVFKTILITFILAGVLYGIVGFMYNPIQGGSDVSAGKDFELDAITAAVIGGVSFTGGIGKISGVVIGALFLQIVQAGLQTMAVPAFYIPIIKGAIILLATALDMKKYIQKK